jgi:hypothetical protein
MTLSGIGLLSTGFGANFWGAVRHIDAKCQRERMGRQLDHDHYKWSSNQVWRKGGAAGTKLNPPVLKMSRWEPFLNAPNLPVSYERMMSSQPTVSHVTTALRLQYIESVPFLVVEREVYTAAS